MSFSLNTPILDMSSEEYHSTEGTWSSSQLKTIIEDLETFHKKYVTKEIERVSIPAFDVGTYFHTGVLEPHKLKKECAIYPGKQRRGAAWEKFQRIHKGKALLTQDNAAQGDRLIKVVKNSPVAMSYVRRGTPEVSMFVVLAVDPISGRVFAPHQELELSREGWVSFKGKHPKNLVELTLKVRADSIDLTDYSFVLDLKSMGENAKNERDCKQSVSNYSYDLSAALYLDIFSAGLEHTVGKFVWAFGSKSYHNSKTWSASQKNILIGRMKWWTAVVELARGIESDWEFSDEEGILEPNPYEEHWLTKTIQPLSSPIPKKKKPKTEKSIYSDLL